MNYNVAHEVRTDSQLQHAATKRATKTISIELTNQQLEAIEKLGRILVARPKTLAHRARPQDPVARSGGTRGPILLAGG
jgi:hypothetical protein